MTKNAVHIRFDGPSLVDHAMDVADLAPSLLALADICKNANKKFNDDKASVKVMVNADVKQNCFELSLELVMTIYEQAKVLVGYDEVVKAKEILEWIGIVGTTAAGGFGLIKLVRAISAGQIEKTEFIDQDGRDLVQITVIGDNNSVRVVQTSPQTYELLKDPANIKSIQKLVEPLTKAGYETLEFEEIGASKEVLTADDAENILSVNSSEVADSLDDKEEPQVITAWVKVYSPVYEANADKWRFVINDRHEYMDISETEIAQHAMQRGGALIDDTYKVRLQMTQSKKSTKITYKILEVLEFHPAKILQQGQLI